MEINYELMEIELRGNSFFSRYCFFVRKAINKSASRLLRGKEALLPLSASSSERQYSDCQYFLPLSRKKVINLAHKKVKIITDYIYKISIKNQDLYIFREIREFREFREILEITWYRCDDWTFYYELFIHIHFHLRGVLHADPWGCAMHQQDQCHLWFI